MVDAALTALKVALAKTGLSKAASHTFVLQTLFVKQKMRQAYLVDCAAMDTTVCAERVRLVLAATKGFTKDQDPMIVLAAGEYDCLILRWDTLNSLFSDLTSTEENVLAWESDRVFVDVSGPKAKLCEDQEKITFRNSLIECLRSCYTSCRNQLYGVTEGNSLTGVEVVVAIAAFNPDPVKLGLPCAVGWLLNYPCVYYNGTTTSSSSAGAGGVSDSAEGADQIGVSALSMVPLRNIAINVSLTNKIASSSSSRGMPITLDLMSFTIPTSLCVEDSLSKDNDDYGQIKKVGKVLDNAISNRISNLSQQQNTDNFVNLLVKAIFLTDDQVIYPSLAI
jgi:hypothetical protein